ncbi:MAG: hypothetical protein MZU95_13465 [Desulfomicrobium escambiense]|nr:hypothetical protein [Desulfomicrobium escambiense]
MVRALEATAITNPKELLQDLERFRGDHYSFMSEVLAVMSTGSLMMGGKDASSCNFGQWLTRQSIDNPESKRCWSRPPGCTSLSTATGLGSASSS